MAKSDEACTILVVPSGPLVMPSPELGDAQFCNYAIATTHNDAGDGLISGIVQPGALMKGSDAAYSCFCVYRFEVYIPEPATWKRTRLYIKHPQQASTSERSMTLQKDLKECDALCRLGLNLKLSPPTDDTRPFADASSFDRFVKRLLDAGAATFLDCDPAFAYRSVSAMLLHGLSQTERMRLSPALTLPPLSDPAHRPLSDPAHSRQNAGKTDVEACCLDALSRFRQVELWSVADLNPGTAAQILGKRLTRTQLGEARLRVRLVMTTTLANASVTTAAIQRQLKPVHDSVGDALVVLDLFGDVTDASVLLRLLSGATETPENAEKGNNVTPECVILVGDEHLCPAPCWPAIFISEPAMWQRHAPIPALLAQKRALSLGYSPDVELPGVAAFFSAKARQQAATLLPKWSRIDLCADDNLKWHQRGSLAPLPSRSVAIRWLHGDRESYPRALPCRATDVAYRLRPGDYVLLNNGDVARVSRVRYHRDTGMPELVLYTGNDDVVAVPASRHPPISALTLHYCAPHCAAWQVDGYI